MRTEHPLRTHSGSEHDDRIHAQLHSNIAPSIAPEIVINLCHTLKARDPSLLEHLMLNAALPLISMLAEQNPLALLQPSAQSGWHIPDFGKKKRLYRIRAPQASLSFAMVAMAFAPSVQIWPPL